MIVGPQYDLHARLPHSKDVRPNSIWGPSQLALAAADKSGLGSARHFSRAGINKPAGRFVRLRQPIVDKHLRIAN